jgi:hypothetical protein
MQRRDHALRLMNNVLRSLESFVAAEGETTYQSRDEYRFAHF